MASTGGVNAVMDGTAFFRIGAACLMLILAAPGSDLALAQTWSGGTPYGGTINVLMQSQDAQTLFAGTDGGLFRSDDGGRHWARKLTGTPGAGPGKFAAFALSKARPGRIYLADYGGSIYRSDDNGETVAHTTVLPESFILQLVAVPGSADKLLAVTANSGLWYSEDAGVSFSPVNAGIDPVVRIRKLIISAHDPSKVMAFPAMNSIPPLYYSLTGGTGWIGSDGIGGVAIVGAFADGMAYVIPDWPGGGIWWNSSNFSAPWMETWWNPPGSAPACTRPNTILPNAVDGSLEWVGCRTGLVGLVEVVAPPMVIDGVPASIRDILHDHIDPTRLWAAADHVGVYTSADSGRSWIPRNTGLSGTGFRAVAVHPHHPQRIFAGYADDSTTTTNPALLLSDDGGTTWTASDLGKLIWLTRAIVVDPTEPRIEATPVYAGGGDNDIGAGIYKSLDGGRTWNRLSDQWTGMVRDLLLDPRSCASPPASGPCVQGPLRTFYAITSGAMRVIRSDDAGASLMDRSAGLPPQLNYENNAGGEDVQPVAIALEPANPERLYIGTYIRHWYGDGEAPAFRLANGVFRSTDGGASWHEANTGLPRYPGSVDTALNVYAIATHPVASGRVWAAVTEENGNDGSRIFRSDDGGDHWTEQVAFPSCDIRRLLVDPLATDSIYATGRSLGSKGTGCVLRSNDGGANWDRVDAGLPATAVMALASVPGEPGHLVAGTNTGVWHLRGDPIFANGFD
ncbi:WD40/YVTN/BNR-like repeat-containing protein [Dokdonella ginsengisoli]|uniref:WD40/YVTN/BNR-like repeat-containing protein n=2 Tax=Dokdonella ginsengisoli TaxID=363846 RepID=A0ABV9QVM8_9GAMM